MRLNRILKIILVVVLLFSPVVSIAQSDSEYSFKRGLEELNAGNHSSALEWFQKAVSQNPNNDWANLYMALLYERYKQYGLALSTINRTIKNIPSSRKSVVSSAYALRGDIYIELGDTVKGLKDYEVAIKAYPANDKVYRFRGQIYYEMGKYDLSDADYEKLIKLDSGDTDAYIGKARNAIERKEWDNVFSLLDYAIKLSPDNSEPYAYRADAYMKVGKNNEAIDDIIKAMSLGGSWKAREMFIDLDKSMYPIVKAKLQILANKEKDNPIWYYFLGEIAELNDYNKDALKYYIKANNINSRSILLERIAFNYYALGDYNAALLMIDKSIAMDSYDDLLMLKGDILNEMGRYDEAISMLDSYIENNSDDGYGYYRRGWFKDEKGDREGAIDDYTIAITLDPTYAYSYIGRGRDYEILGQSDLARKDYLKVIELDTEPDDNSCAQYAYLFLGEKDKAIEFMNRYLETSDSRTGGTYDAACLYSLMGETEKALEYLEQALERGYRRFAHMAVDRDLENIRSLVEYKHLIEKYKKIQEQENEPVDDNNS